MFTLMVGLVIIFSFFIFLYAFFSIANGIIKEIENILWERKESKKAKPEMDRLGFKDFSKYQSYLWDKKFEEDKKSGKFQSWNWVP